ncbi:SigE family RNA polymerase sigma factor [Dactylosporangium siamense]|uniref:DNA-directed RNA polymerase sigma-70 factor n=1 Tax=Dactylosporangium siamense TaxID=685454 RepID=A0A919PL06_9ACTN|nr:SigE family RNA polymerase sigma factor [Dactylosporangium siamense]GIG45899.1 DNA-directed RNA polymerase sigma-70 factor [Dactylosporangium siamense]
MESKTGPEGFEEFVRGRAAGLLRYGYVLTGSSHDAADLVQEALVRLGAGWSRVRQKGNPEGYVRTTMARLYISWWRRRRRELLVSEVPDRPGHDGEPALNEQSGLWQALLRLPPGRRAVLVLRYYEVCTDEEIASILGVSRGTVRSQAARGLEQLSKTWEPADGSTAALLKEPT